MAVVYCLEELVAGVPSSRCLTAKHLDVLELLCGAERTLFHEEGIYMLDSVVRLQIVCGGEFFPQVARLANTLASQSRPLELIEQLCEVIGYLLRSQTGHPLEQLASGLIETDSGYLDVFKSVVSMYVPHILRNLSPEELDAGLSGLSEYFDYIEKDIESNFACLGSPAYMEIVEIMREQEREDMLLIFLELYEKSGAFTEKKLQIAQSIVRGDFLLLFHQWNLGKITADGIGILATLTISGDIPGLPYVLSGMYRFQVYLPIAVYQSSLSRFYQLLHHALDHIDRKFRFV